MLNNEKKNMNIITFCITIFVCLILFIILDACFLKTENTKYFEKIYANYQEYSKLKRKNQNKDAIELKDTFLETMQIADIYDENIRIEEDTEEITIDLTSEWRIEIPAINLIAPIKSGTTQDVLAIAVGHFTESEYWYGNVALAAHNRGYISNFFKDIKKLEIGDKIIYYTPQGKREYTVVTNKIIKQTDWSYIENTEDNRITLITCVENMYEYRRCVQAVEAI